MSPLITSLVRTYSPLVVGVLTESLTAMSETVQLDTQPGVVTSVTAAVYYFIPRVAEHLGYKNAGLFLGSRKTPSYGAAEDSLIAAEDAELPWGE